jgi:hypothetical protein
VASAPRHLDSGALGLGLLLGGEREKRDPRGRRERHDAGRRQQEQPSPQRLAISAGRTFEERR